MQTRIAAAILELAAAKFPVPGPVELFTNLSTWQWHYTFKHGAVRETNNVQDDTPCVSHEHKDAVVTSILDLIIKYSNVVL